MSNNFIQEPASYALHIHPSALLRTGWVFVCMLAAYAVSINAAESPDGRWAGELFEIGCNGSVQAIVGGPEGKVYIGGLFDSCGGVSANGVVRYEPETGTWSALGNDGGSGVNGGVWALALTESALYVGGNFTEASTGGGSPVAANRIARWDLENDSWSSLGHNGGNGLNDDIYSITHSNNALFVGGSFTLANLGSSIDANRVARWDLDTGTWSAIGTGGGNGVNDYVYALLVIGTDLYIGGQFNQVNCMSDFPCDGIAANGIIRWTGASWENVGNEGGNGVDGPVVVLEPSETGLYVGGGFGEANVDGSSPVPANYIAHWDANASTWSSLGSDGGNGVTHCTVFALARSGTDLYVGGCFGTANSGGSDPIAASNIARWNGSQWSTLGSGTDGTVRALALSDPDMLYVGGDFNLAGNQPSSRIGRYTTRGTLDIALTGPGIGSVTSDPAGLTCPGSCTAKFSWDQPITLTASADPGSEFVGWAGGGCSGTASCVVDFDQDTSVTAQFDLITYTVTTIAINGSITSDIDPEIEHGQTATITGENNANHYFASVSGCGGIKQLNTDQSVTNFSYETGAITEACTVEAVFAIRTYTVTTTATNGTITSSIDPEIEHGQTTTVTGETDANHYFSSVSGCGGTEQTNTDQSVNDFSFETGEIVADCTVTAEFAIVAFDISVADIQGEGTVDVLTPQVDYGGNAEFEVIPDSGWSLASFTGNTCTPIDNSDGTWTAANIIENCAVEAVFIEETDEIFSDRFQEPPPRFFLDANGVTVRCPEAEIGEQGGG